MGLFASISYRAEEAGYVWNIVTPINSSEGYTDTWETQRHRPRMLSMSSSMSTICHSDARLWVVMNLIFWHLGWKILTCLASSTLRHLAFSDLLRGTQQSSQWDFKYHLKHNSNRSAVQIPVRCWIVDSCDWQDNHWKCTCIKKKFASENVDIFNEIFVKN